MLAYEMNHKRKLNLITRKEPIATDDNVIVKIEKTSICGTDVRTYTKGSDKIEVPKTIGHEFSGNIFHIGKNIESELKLSDRVTVAPAIGCGKCWPCSTGHTNMCDDLRTLGFQYEGSFTEYSEIPHQALVMGNIIKLPDVVDYASASLIEPVGCALNAQRYVNVKPGDFVAIYGAGFIGCMHAELALLRGASKVIMIEPAEVRGKQAQEFIKDLFLINPKREDTVERVREITAGRGANVVIIANSVPGCQVEAQVIAAKMGRISLFGGLAGESIGFIDSNIIHYKELQISGVHATTPEMMKEILMMVASGKLNLKKYISRELSLMEIEQGFAAILNDNVMKVVLTP